MVSNSNDSTALVYCMNGHRYDERFVRRINKSGYVRVPCWKWMSYDGAGLLERIHRRFTAEVYEHILANIMIPSARKRYPEGTLFFQQDNHPIENLWAAVKRILRSNWAEQPPVRAPEELWDRVLNAWEEMAKNLDLFHNLVDSMLRRMRAGLTQEMLKWTGEGEHCVRIPLYFLWDIVPGTDPCCKPVAARVSNNRVVGDYSDEEEDFSSNDEGEAEGSDSEPMPEDAMGRRARKASRTKIPANARQRNLKQKFIALLKRFRVSEDLQGLDNDQEAIGQKLSGGDVDPTEIEDLFEELEDLSDSGPELDTMSISSTPKPSLRPFFSSSRSLLQETLNVPGLAATVVSMDEIATTCEESCLKISVPFRTVGHWVDLHQTLFGNAVAQ
ncbi:hypothetical protein ANN_19215 [Periplaneta americana]|uniref:Uncharacterized protein n=1 Tax=Periplaneta americana TaxID=6978 RepID=A0ABQ8SA58_PERAM|nr:hypothetical protein ANN_19215 [Periplaneta americana]